MKSTLLMLAILASIAFGNAAWAQPQESAAPAASSKVKGLSGVLGGAFTITDGQCTDGFSNQCKSTNCKCYTFTTTSDTFAKVSRAGTGRGTFSATFDFGSGVTSGLDGACWPIWGQLTMDLSKDTESWSAVGQGCNDVKGNSLQVDGGLALQPGSIIYSDGIATFKIIYHPPSVGFHMTFTGKAH